jgi:kynurenine formamidase
MKLTPQTRELEQRALSQLDSLSNWGKWGTKDERGALNWVNSAAVMRGLSTVRRAQVYALGNRIGPDSPVSAGLPRPVHYMLRDAGDAAIADSGPSAEHYALDALFISAIHETTTHVDALCHIWTEGKMYNGFADRTVPSAGAQHLGIERFEGVVTRGLLLDLAGFYSRDVLDADHLITAEDLAQCAKAQGVSVESGDAVLIRTGWRSVYQSDRPRYSQMQPGLGPSAGLFLAEQEVCLMGADNTAVQAWGGGPDDPRVGLTDVLHKPLLRNLGIYLLEMLNLEALAADRVYEFMFCLAPLLIEGGTTSPVNPLAVA